MRVVSWLMSVCALAAFVFLLIVVSRLPASGTELHSWVEQDGVLAFSDKEESVPPAYKDSATKTTLLPLAECSRFSFPTKPANLREVPSLEEELARLRFSVPIVKKVTQCGIARYYSERRDIADGASGLLHNRRFYIVRDDCGVLFDAPFSPRRFERKDAR